MKTISAIILIFLFGTNTQLNAQCTYGTIDNAVVNYTCKGSIRLEGKIDGKSLVTLRSEEGDIYITEKIDGASNVTLEAPKGSVTIGWNIDGKSTVNILCAGDINVKGKIDGESNVDLNTRGNILIGDKVDHPNTTVRWYGKSFKANNCTNQSKIIEY